MQRAGAEPTGQDFDALTSALGEGDVRRAVRWLNRRGGLMPMPRQAGDLLAVRLATRRRVGLPWAWGTGVAVVGYLLWPVTDLPGDSEAALHAQARIGLPLLVCAMAVSLWPLQVMQQRAERGIATALPFRIRRATAAPLQVLVGRRRLWAWLAAVGVMLVLNLALLVATPGWPTALRMIAWVAAVAAASMTARQAITREPIAYDGFSLAVDERLRSDETQRAIQPLGLLLFACSASPATLNPTLPDGAVAGLAVGWFLTLIALLVALTDRPWDNPQAACWTPPVQALQEGT
jgi:hypothetical protein